MRLGLLASLSSILLLATSPALANPRIHRGPTAPRLFKSRAVAPRPKMSGIAPERAAQIQAALVKAGYLSAAPLGTAASGVWTSGVWDSTTQAAMEKLQADNGWQTRLVPDARAIIKLGLGPGSTPAAVTAATDSTETESAGSSR